MKDCPFCKAGVPKINAVLFIKDGKATILPESVAKKVCGIQEFPWDESKDFVVGKYGDRFFFVKKGESNEPEVLRVPDLSEGPIDDQEPVSDSPCYTIESPPDQGITQEG